MKRFLTLLVLMAFFAPSAICGTQVADTVADVYARQLNSNQVEVVWSWSGIPTMTTSRNTDCQYNLYRKNVLDNKSELLAENLTDTSYVDDKWADLDYGAYKWGVEIATSSRNDNRNTILAVDFEDGLMPEGWITTTEQVYPTTSEWNVSSGLAYTNFPANGQYSVFSNGTGYQGLHYNMITSAIDLKSAETATLSFDYANLEFLGDICVFNLKVASSQEGPWETVFTTAEDINVWTAKTIDLSEYAGQTIYIAFENEDYNGFGIGVDNIVISFTEPKIVWSNKLDKDMFTTVNVNVSLNTDESLEDTEVSFINISEFGEGYDYSVKLDATGIYTWDEFRKGTYEYTVYKKGYTSCVTKEIVEIADAASLTCELEEIIGNVKSLYVSPTGLAIWESDEERARLLEDYTISLNGVEEATVTTLYYQHENLTSGETYTTKVVANYASGESVPAEYTWVYVVCDEYEGATDFDAKYTDGKAVLSWQLPEGDLVTEVLNYDDTINFNYIGQQNGDNFYWGVMFPAEDMMKGDLTKVMMFDGQAHTGDIYIYLGGNTVPETLVTTQSYECTAIGDYVDFKLLQPVAIDGTKNLWIVFANNDNSTQVAPAADVESENGSWASIDGEEWFNIADLFGFPMTWQVRGYIERGANPIGVVLYRDGELLVEEIISEESYSDPMTVAGTYEYCLKVVYTNYATSCLQSMKFVFDGVSVAETAANTMRLCPNPVKGNLTIAAENMTSITIINALGQIVFDKVAVNDNEVVNMSHYEAGVYFVRVTTETDVTVERITVIK